MPIRSTAVRIAFVLIIAVALPLHGQTQKLYAPLLTATDAADLGLALVNPAVAEAQVTMTARDYSGVVVQKDGLTNPVTLNLPARSQRALRASEIFGSGIKGQTGWLELSVSTPVVKGSFVLFDSGLSFVDGTELLEVPSSRLVFPSVSASGSSLTRLTLVNTTPTAVQAIISIYENTGRLAGTQVIDLPGQGGFAGTAEELIPLPVAFEGYAVVETEPKPAQGNSDALIGFETYRNRSDLALVRAFPESARLRIGYLAHLASQDGYSTRLTLVNYGGYSQVFQITADGLEVNGKSRNPSSARIERVLPPNGRLSASLEQLFNLFGRSLVTGYIRYETQGDTPGAFGYLEFGTSDGIALAAVEAQGAGGSDILFSHVADDLDYWTGVSLLNPNSQPSTVTLDAFDREGRRTGSTVLTLEGREHKASLLSEWFRGAFRQLGGYIRVTATTPILALELFGSRASSNFLANVAAQGATLKPQISGLNVSASSGGDVIFGGGTGSLLVPPRALTVDTPIGVASISVSQFPRLSANQRPVSAVEARPAGTSFQIPGRLNFPLNIHLLPGTQIPLWVLNRQTNQYEATEFVAIVDGSSRAASAEVTSLATFVIMLPDNQIVNIASLSPSNGLAGTTVTIMGDGFSPNPAEDVVTFAGTRYPAVRATVLSASTSTLEVAVPADAATGPVIVQVGSKSSIGVIFTLPELSPQPLITSISPSTVPLVQLVNIKIFGSGFENKSVVTWDGNSLASTFIDSTHLAVTVDSPQPAVHKISVINPAPGGGSSNLAEFTVAFPTPAISSLDQIQIGTVEVVITGAGFTPLSMVQMDWVNQQTTFVNTTTLRTTLSYSGGRRLISVLNPTPVRGPSNTVAVRFNLPPIANAGSGQTVTLPNSANLNGTATDDGLPAESILLTTWSKVSGPGVVIFGDVNAVSTTASFSTTGIYVLRLTATDGARTASDDVTIIVAAPRPAPGLGDAASHAPPTIGAYAYATWNPAQSGFPRVGQAYVDPVFGSTVRRITSEFPLQSESQIYAKNGWWNADGTRMAHKTRDTWELVDPANGMIVQTDLPAGSEQTDNSFDPVDPNVWYYYSGADLKQFNIQTGISSTVKTFPNTLMSLGGSVDWIDRTGRYFLVGYSNRAHIWDKQTNTIYTGGVDISALGDGWIGITPSGNYIVVAQTPNKMSYAIDHAVRTVAHTGTMFWSLCGDHGDLVSASDGKDYFVTFECNEIGAIYRVDVTIPQTPDNADKQRADNFMLVDLDWPDTDGHFSCATKAPNRDWCYISTEANDDTFIDMGPWRPYKQEILMVQVVPPYAVRRLAHHRSRNLDCPICIFGGYEYTPRLSASWDGLKVAWASNFGYSITPAEYADIYVLETPTLAYSAPAALVSYELAMSTTQNAHWVFQAVATVERSEEIPKQAGSRDLLDVRQRDEHGETDPNNQGPESVWADRRIARPAERGPKDGTTDLPVPIEHHPVLGRGS